MAQKRTLDRVVSEVGSHRVSVAVVPFTAPPAADNPAEYLVRGFVDDVVTELTRFSNLLVFALHSTAKTSPEQLGADYLLTGTIRLAGPRLRVTSQLVERTTGSVVWAERFDKLADDIFAIQDEISAQVVAAVSLRLNEKLTAASKRKPECEWRTYDYWLQGADLLRQGSVQADGQARQLFEKALETNKSYGRAYLGLSLSYFNEWSCQLWDAWNENEERAFEYAQQALEHDRDDYFAELVVGRVLLFRREFERAERHLRRSIALNCNDADALVQVAAAMAFLDRCEESRALFERAQRLNPLHEPWYYAFALPLAFIERRYTDLVRYGELIGAPIMVDLPAYTAAAHTLLGNNARAQADLQVYLQQFELKILHGREAEPGQALRWMRHVNPYRNTEHESRLLDALGASSGALESVPLVMRPSRELNVFCRVGSLWQMSFDGHDVWLPAIKGFTDVQTLLSAPGRKFHCSELMGVVDSMHDDLVFDNDSKAAYKARLAELRTALEEAETDHDWGRKERLRQEHDALSEHLVSSLGVTGRPRKLEAPSERARSAVTQRIKAAVKKVTATHPSLGAHLSESVQTGTFCCYQPRSALDWRLAPGPSSC